MKQDDSFGKWYKNEGFKITGNTKPECHFLKVQSEALHIDTIFRSMQGPYNNKQISFESSGEKLVWLTGYDVKIIDVKTAAQTSDGFMCHNNLEIFNSKVFPWKVKTKGTNIRLFTLTEGQTKVNFPEGFGIPIPAKKKLELSSQVLNHNMPDINIYVKHEVNIKYLKQSELREPMIPLYQQAIFVTKQVSGPAGAYGIAPSCNKPVNNESSKAGISGGKDDCCTPAIIENYNPNVDTYNRKFTGHWVLPLGEQVLQTEVTQMMDLKFDTHIHYIGVHMHPFAKSLELRDITTDSTLYIARVAGQDSLIGIKSIESYSNATGIPVYRNHRYELISTYNCTDSTTVHTAMATMFLYLRDK